MPSLPSSRDANLNLLATTATIDQESDMYCDQPIQASHFPCDASDTSSSPSDSPVQSYRRPTNLKSRPSRSVARSQKTSQPYTKRSATVDQSKLSRVERIVSRAKAIKSISNSPVNQYQQAILLTVYDNITQFPTDHWQAILAVATDRTMAQVRNWFSNMRQKKRTEDEDEMHVSYAQTKEGMTVKFRPCALRVCGVWSDDLFEGVVGLARLTANALPDTKA